MNTPKGAQPRFERGREVIEAGPVRGIPPEALDCALARTTRSHYGTALQDGCAGRKDFTQRELRLAREENKALRRVLQGTST